MSKAADKRLAIACALAISDARSDLFLNVLAHAEKTAETPLSLSERKLLCSEGVLQMAEFFFAMSAPGRATPEALTEIMSAHNAEMQQQIDACSKGHTEFGLSSNRLRDAMFSKAQMNLVVHESSSGRATFDQRSLGKLMVKLMSFESCRALALLLAKCGLLKRFQIGNMVLINSDGTLETYYQQYLLDIAREITKASK